MRLAQLATRNIAGSSFRSWIVFFCALLMAGFVTSSTLVIRGANTSLSLALERLGADIIVVPSGNEERLESAVLMGIPAHMWMHESVTDRVRAVPGVAAASPQLYLATLRGASCCSVPEMFLIAYDPETDFTLRPWLEENLQGDLALGQSVGGAFVYVPADLDGLKVYGYQLDIVGKLGATGTGLDQSMFFTFDTAYEIARLSPEQAVKKLDIPPDNVSSVLVKVDRGADAHAVATRIEDTIQGVSAMETNNLFQGQRAQILSLLNSVFVLLGISWLLAMALVAVVFAIAVNERRREIGVMRALGARRTTVLQSLLIEAGLLAVAGGTSGSIVVILAVYLFRNLIIGMMGVPFLFPGIPQLLLLGLGSVALVLLSVLAAALLPTFRISVQDPALAMRE
ncbi:MAG: ABC transporter permease [Anaerolineae bacterium]|jgi:putative ABC transport system permease protein